jgi:NADH:ubiquinone oxidoreductase subunit 5 (subunit L)/multisubunit Na+/H+ antiporter MnhA subunit
MAVVVYQLVPGLSTAIATIAWPLQRLFSGLYFVDELYERVVVAPLAGLSRFTSRVLNQLMIEGSGPALGGVTRAVGELACRLTTGQVATYVLLMLAGVAFFFSIFVQVR